ncbi:MAG: hypothetical protein JRI23_20195 [Deltaproteobacteria bacterium]|jgi:hypothetical protein|nr:hypothetical protein [Deltaproteobacteria bacterium]
MASDVAGRRRTRRAAEGWALLRPYLLACLAVVPAALLTIARVLEEAGEPALPLDDAFIHLQYAARLAEGHWFSYAPGAGYSSGATSLLWPLVVAPFAAVGLEGLELVWVVWAFGVLAHAAVSVEAFRLAAGLAGRLAGWFAAAMCVAFGPFVWFSLSGMETIPFAWLLCRAVRVAADLSESPAPSFGQRLEVALLGFAAPLLRPEGIVASGIAIVALLVAWRRSRAGEGRLGGLGVVGLPLVGPGVTPGMHWLLTGQATSSTAMVKWLALDPYLDAAGVAARTWEQARFLWTNVMQGGPWTVLFLPEGFGYAVLVGAAAVAVLGTRAGRRSVGAVGACRLDATRRTRWRALFVLAVIAATLIPSTYGTMLWNRVRYVWPFAPAWFVAIASLGCVVGGLAARLRSPLAAATPALLAAAVAALVTKLPWTMFDLAQSSGAIARQQVEMGRWAAVLPPSARLGVNDTGAIAYLSRRRTFDVVGLTTPGEARFWVAGAGARFEHYERLGPTRLPSHFIVYPHWMACPPVLGAELHRRTVLSQTILGGATMVAYEARYDLLESGARPFSQGRFGELLDEVDVADLESEAAHDWELGRATAADSRAVMWPTPDGRVVADGGRFRRQRDLFRLTIPADTPTVLVMRVVAEEPLELVVDGSTIGRAEEQAVRGAAVDPDVARWVELAVELPRLPVAEDLRRRVLVRSAAGTEFASFHYWLFLR